MSFGARARADARWTKRKSVKAHEAYLCAGSLYSLEDNAVTNINLGSLEPRTEVKLTAPSAGEHICPLGADMLYVAKREDPLMVRANGSEWNSIEADAIRLSPRRATDGVLGERLRSGCHLFDYNPLRTCRRWLLLRRW